MLLQLFISFAKIGLLTFGGGMAMLPMLEREIINKRKWATQGEMADYYAIGQCTPGIIAVNTATFVGNKCAGTAGGIVATLGVVFPSLVIITFLASVIARFSHLAVVQSAFSGIQVAVCVLIFNSMMKLRKASVVDRLTDIIFLSVLILSVFSDVSPVMFVLLSACIGIMAKRAQWKETNSSKDSGSGAEEGPNENAGTKGAEEGHNEKDGTKGAEEIPNEKAGTGDAG